MLCLVLSVQKNSSSMRPGQRKSRKTRVQRAE